jgi:NAD(P)-dependent dehydrogenase (short-subunit alcohol dehydrogenase family)
MRPRHGQNPPETEPSRKRVALVTGAAGGLGSATAALLRNTGWAVAGVDCATGTNPVGTAMMAKADVADAAAMRAAADAVRTELGPISLVVCAAATYQEASIDRFEAEAHARVFDVNYGGVVNTIAATLPEMLAQGEGRLVIVSSLAGYRRARPDISGYAASKAALVSLADGLDQELRGSGVAVRLVAPGFIDTPLMHAAGGIKRLALSPERAARYVVDAAMGRRFETRFPWGQAGLVSLFGLLPRAVHRLGSGL